MHQQRKDWGETKDLGTWKTGLERHGPLVAYAALQAGTLPYVPRGPLSDGHGLAWPDSHEFVVSRKFWKNTWRNELTFLSEAETSETERQINEWLNCETVMDSTT